MMFLMSSSSSACFGVAGIVGLTGVAGVLACSGGPRLLPVPGSGLVPVSHGLWAVVAAAGLGTWLVAAGRLSVAVGATALADAVGSCGVPSSGGPDGALVVPRVGGGGLTVLGSGVGPTEAAGDKGRVVGAAVVGSLLGVGGHPTGEGFRTASPARPLGRRSWSSISRSTVLSPLNSSSSAARTRASAEPRASSHRPVSLVPSPPVWVWALDAHSDALSGDLPAGPAARPTRPALAPRHP